MIFIARDSAEFQNKTKIDVFRFLNNECLKTKQMFFFPEVLYIVSHEEIVLCDIVSQRRDFLTFLILLLLFYLFIYFEKL